MCACEDFHLTTSNEIWSAKIPVHWNENISFGIEISSYTVDNSLYDVINLSIIITYTSHFEDAFYWLNVNIIAIVYYKYLIVIEIQYGIINHPEYKMLTLKLVTLY